MKKSAMGLTRQRTLSHVAVFPQKLALAKPMTHDGFAIEQFVNGPSMNSTGEQSDVLANVAKP
jgi:hypothetical protein